MHGVILIKIECIVKNNNETFFMINKEDRKYAEK